jgi:hypothetical protein
MKGGSIIRVELGAGGWAAVPRSALDNDQLSLAARGLLAWFLTRGDGFSVQVEAARRKFTLGRHAWATLAAELTAAGHYHRATVRDVRGRVRTVVSITALPSLSPQGTDAGFPDTGTDAGFPDTGTDVGFSDSRLNRQPVNQTSNKRQEEQEKRTTTTTPPAVGGGGVSALVFRGAEPPAALKNVLRASSCSLDEYQALLEELEGAAAAAAAAGSDVPLSWSIMRPS